MKMVASKAPVADNLPKGTDTFVPLELIVQHKELPPRDVDQNNVDELFHSIKRSGLDTRLTLWGGDKSGTKMTVGGKEHPASFLIAGNHRRAALRKLLKDDPDRFNALFPNGIPCTIRICPLSEALLIQLRENVMRKDMTPEQILPVLQHLTKLGVKQNVIAIRIGKSTGWVSQMLDIAENLGEEGLEEVAKGGLTVRDARAAGKEIKKAKKDGKPVSAKEAVSKLKQKIEEKRKGKKRVEKRASIKLLYNRYSVLPSNVTQGRRVQILEGICEYLIGESDDLPKEVASDKEEKE